MVEFTGDGDGTSFPVVFFDGETETEIGDVTVFPSLGLKRFQSILSQKIGISPHQFSVHLSSPESRRRIPITGKVNFSAISREKGCFFVVVLKRSRRERQRRNSGCGQHHRRGGEGRRFNGNGVFHPPENVMILKRSDSSSAFFPGRNWHHHEQARLAGLAMERDMYLMNMGLIGPRFYSVPPAEKEEEEESAVCEECSRASESGREIGFHWCVYDAVTFGFRSVAGPIARPFKGSD